MALDGLKISNLIISESQTLLEVFDHLFDLPPFGVVFDDIDGSQMNIRTDKVSGFLTFFFHYHDSHFPQSLNVSNKPGDAQCFGFSIHEQRDLSIGRTQIQKACHVGFFPIHPENRIGFELRNHMIATLSTDLSQRFGPVPAIGQDIELTMDRQRKGSDDLLSQGDFGLKGAATPHPFRMIELGPQGEKRIFVEQGREDPLMAKDIGHVLGMILMPTTARNLLACLFNKGVIHDKKDNIPGSDPQRLEELMQSGLRDLLHSPKVFSQKSSKAGERSPEDRMSRGLHHGGSVEFFSQLDETDDKAREDFKRRS